MTLMGHGEVSATNQQRNDKLQEVEHKEDRHNAVLTETSNIYRIYNGRPQRLLPTWSSTNYTHGSKLPYYHKFHQSLLIRYDGRARSETAPFHFDVASKYYVICLRHLRC